jgi:hypothetical protein
MRGSLGFTACVRSVSLLTVERPLPLPLTPPPPHSHQVMCHPVAYLVCNFPPSTPGCPPLLTFSDVRTLFHEMGHGLQVGGDRGGGGREYPPRSGRKETARGRGYRMEKTAENAPSEPCLILSGRPCPRFHSTC